MDVGCDNWMSHTHMRSFIWRTMHINDSWHTYEWVMAYIWMSHGIHMNESWAHMTWYHHISISHTHMRLFIWKTIQINMPWHTYEWVMAYIWMSHGIHMNESCIHLNESCTYDVKHMNKSHTHEVIYIMSHMWMSYAYMRSYIWMSHARMTSDLSIRHTHVRWYIWKRKQDNTG